MFSQSYRRKRLNKLLQEEISKIIQELKDPRIGFITITEVELSNDMSSAAVFYSVLGEKKDKIQTEKALLNAKGYIKYRIAQELSIRKIPDFKFIFDTSIERATKIFSLLDKIDEESRQKKI